MKIFTSASRFALVGICATLVHVALATVLIERLLLHPAAANGIAFVTANLVSYTANTLWSFGSRPALGNWVRFALVSLAAGALTMAIAGAVHAAGGHHLLGILVVVVVVPGLSFFAHRLFTYRN